MAEPTFEELSLDTILEMDGEQAVHMLIHHASQMNASDVFF